MAKSTNLDLDAIDRRILEVLQRDGRIPIVDLADRVGLSPTPCQRRVRRMEADGVIQRYAAVVDPGRVGQVLQAFVEVTLSDHAEETVTAFRRAITERSDVIACYAVSGERDFMLHVVATDFESYSRFALEALLRMPGVRNTQSQFVISVLKPPGNIPIED